MFCQSDQQIWLKCSHELFTRVWYPLTCWLSKGFLNPSFLETGPTRSFKVCYFRNKVAMKIISFSKCLKFDVDSRNRTRKLDKVFLFKNNCIWIEDNQLSQSRTGYLWLAVNVLRNIPNISDITKGNILQIRFSQSDEKTWWKASLADFTRIWDPLTCWESKCPLKRCFLESGLTKSFTVCNFRNKVAMKGIFFFKMFKIWCRFQKWNRRIKNFFFVLKIIASESGTINSHNPEHNSCHWQPVCYETPLRFNI